MKGLTPAIKRFCLAASSPLLTAHCLELITWAHLTGRGGECSPPVCQKEGPEQSERKTSLHKLIIISWFSRREAKLSWEVLCSSFVKGGGCN